MAALRSMRTLQGGLEKNAQSLARHMFCASRHVIKHYTSHYLSMSSCSNAASILVNILTILCKLNVNGTTSEMTSPVRK